MDSNIICHVHDQLRDIENRFSVSLGCNAFEELQRSTGLVDAQLGQIPCGTEAWDEVCDRLQHILFKLHHLQTAVPMLCALNHSERSLRQSRISTALEGTFSWVFQEQTDDAINAHFRSEPFLGHRQIMFREIDIDEICFRTSGYPDLTAEMGWA